MRSRGIAKGGGLLFFYTEARYVEEASKNTGRAGVRDQDGDGGYL